MFPYLALQQAHEQALALRGDVRREAELRVEDLVVHPLHVLQFCFLSGDHEIWYAMVASHRIGNNGEKGQTGQETPT